MAITPEEFELIRKFIHEHSGILIGEGKEYLVENRLTTLLVQNGCETFRDLHQKLVADSGPLRNKVVDAMTTNETLWFRDDSFFTALSSTIIPWLIEKSSKQPLVRIWSAACSTGQEPYSLAMLIDDAMARMNLSGPTLAKFEILATDISPSALMIAQTARYSQLAISRGMRQNFLDRYFEKKGMAYELVPSLRQIVKFKQFNLKSSFREHGQFDMILIRNVLIYFSDELKKEIYAKLHGSLAADGLLTIGASESPRGYTTDFEQIMVGSSAMFRPKGAGGHLVMQFPKFDLSKQAGMGT